MSVDVRDFDVKPDCLLDCPVLKMDKESAEFYQRAEQELADHLRQAEGCTDSVQIVKRGHGIVAICTLFGIEAEVPR